MPNYDKCHQATRYYCPHCKNYRADCDAAKKDLVMCVHIAALARSTLALSGVRALAKALNRDVLVEEAIKTALQEIELAGGLKKALFEELTGGREEGYLE